MVSGAGPTKKARCSSTSTNTSRTRPRTCWPCCPTPATGSSRRLKKQSALVQKNIDALAGLLQLNPAERALLLYGTLARCQRDLRGLLVEFKVVQRPGGLCRAGRGGRCRRARRRRGAARRFAARTHRHDREPDLRAEHHRPGRPDEGQRTAAAGADARIRRPGRPDGGVHAAGAARASCARRLRLRRRRRAGADRAAAQRHRAPRGRCQRAAVRARRAPARPNWPRCARRPRGWSCTRWNTPTATATACRPRPLPQPADQPGLPEGQRAAWRCCSTRWKTCSRPSAPRPRS
jgi:hypothetical protein